MTALHLLDRVDAPSADRPPTEIEDSDRRTFVTGAAAGLAALLPGCAPTEPEPGQTTARAFRTIKTAMGQVDVPAAPRRIVAADAFTLQCLDELGAPLVAAATFPDGSRSGVSQRAKELPSIGWFEADFEALASAHPDVIIGITEWHQDNYPRLSQIAPTVLYSYTEAENWRDNYRVPATAAGLGAEATAALTVVTKRLSQLKPQVRRAWPNGVRVTVLRIRDLTGIESYTSLPQNITSIGLLAELDGVTLTGDGLSIRPGEVKVDLSMERLADADADVLLYYVGGGDQTGADVSAIEKELTGHPLWLRLTAVRENRAFSGDQAAWFNAADVEGANLVLDDLFAHLT
jgi:iron complex transport system substrate-binding protein